MKERFYSDRIDFPATVRRIAVLRALHLGDLLCATPAWRALHRRFPQAEITLIGLPWMRDFIDRLFYIDRLLPFPGYPGLPETSYDPERTNAFLAAARAYGYDLALQMHGDGSASNGLVADLGAAVCAGYRNGGDDRLTLGLPYRHDENEVLRWLRLVESLPGGAPASDVPSSAVLDFPITPDENTRAGELLPTPALAMRIGLHPGSKLHDRRWPAERFAALADALVERYRANIIFTGNDDERPLVTDIRRRMHYSALDLTGRTDLGTFAAVIHRLNLLVTNDTGASHVAAATGTPSVVLFGPSRPTQWAPLDRQYHHAIDALALAGPGIDPADALQNLPIEPVLSACTSLLSAITDPHRFYHAPEFPRVSSTAARHKE